MEPPKSSPSTASGWVKWHSWNARTMRPVIDWVCRAAQLRPGHHVLDVACGTGLPALAVASAVRPGGRVVATDIDPRMLAATGDHARAAGLDDIELREMSAERLDVEDASFDAVTCAFGLMFARDDAQAAAEIRRVLKPGGLAVVAVWAPLEDNAFFRTVFETVGRLSPAGPPRDPDAPGPFRHAAPGKLEGLLRAAGYSSVSVEDISFDFEIESVSQHWEIVADMTPAVKAAAASLPAEELGIWKDALAAAVRPWLKDGRVRLPMKARGATAVR